jgi:hypothetical protein
MTAEQRPRSPFLPASNVLPIVDISFPGRLLNW